MRSGSARPRPHWRGGTLAALLAMTSALPSCESAASEDTARARDPIIGGTPDTKHPAVVSLLKQVEGGFYPACSGTLITQNLVLTAHHCVAPLSSGSTANVECGETQFEATEAARSIRVAVEQDVWNGERQPYRVAEVWVPTGSSEVCGRDIALLLLAGDGVPLSVAVPIAPRLETRPEPKESFLAVGYGLQDPGDGTGKTAGQRMVSADAQVLCNGAACGTPMVTESEFVAASPVCSGDSGGPAIDGEGLVSGVTSRGDVECTIGIYSSAAAWKEFIIDKTFVAAQSGAYVPPVWAGTPPPGYVSAVDPLGLGCNGACPLGYACWSESSTPPGVCVPPCGFGLAECPTGYSCDPRLSACTPEPPPPKDDGGCALSAPRPSSFGSFALALGLLALQTLRRRRN